MNCTCGKGRDDKDEVRQTGPGSNGTRLTEEEWAGVRTGRLDAAKLAKPDLLSEGADESPSRGQHRKRLTRNKEDANGIDSPLLPPGAMGSPSPARGERGMGESGREESERRPRVTSPGNATREESNGNHDSQLRFAVGDRVRCACSRW
eukprot:1047433-Rhodomonas_salina.1